MQEWHWCKLLRWGQLYRATGFYLLNLAERSEAGILQHRAVYGEASMSSAQTWA